MLTNNPRGINQHSKGAGAKSAPTGAVATRLSQRMGSFIDRLASQGKKLGANSALTKEHAKANFDHAAGRRVKNLAGKAAKAGAGGTKMLRDSTAKLIREERNWLRKGSK